MRSSSQVIWALELLPVQSLSSVFLFLMPFSPERKTHRLLTLNFSFRAASDRIIFDPFILISFFFLYVDFSQFCQPAKKIYFKAGSPRDEKRAREMREKEIDRCLTFHHPSSLQLSLHLLLFCIFFFCLFPLMPFYFFVLLFIYIHICVVFFLMFSF